MNVHISFQYLRNIHKMVGSGPDDVFKNHVHVCHNDIRHGSSKKSGAVQESHNFHLTPEFE